MHPVLMMFHNSTDVCTAAFQQFFANIIAIQVRHRSIDVESNALSCAELSLNWKSNRELNKNLHNKSVSGRYEIQRSQTQTCLILLIESVAMILHSTNLQCLCLPVNIPSAAPRVTLIFARCMTGVFSPMNTTKMNFDRIASTVCRTSLPITCTTKHNKKQQINQFRSILNNTMQFNQSTQVAQREREKKKKNTFRPPNMTWL